MAKREESTTAFGWLPEGIIHRVLSFLGTDDKQKARYLSKEWSNAYDRYPKLCFNGINEQHFNNTLSRHVSGGIPLPYQMEITLGFDDADDAARLDKWLKIAAENGVSELKVQLGCLRHSGYIIPDCILGSKSLNMLSLVNCKFRDSLKQQILCKNVHTLVLRDVSVKDDVFSSLLKGCPLIEYLRVENCTNLSKVELINVPRLKELHIIGNFMFRADYLSFLCQPYFVQPQPPQVHQNLQTLRFVETKLSEAFFHNFTNRFPNLRSLVIRCCYGFQKMKLTSHSLRYLEFGSHFLGEQELEINAPSLTSFGLTPYNNCPKVFFTAVSSRIKSNVSLSFVFPMSKSMLLRLNETLSNLAPFKKSLDIVFATSNEGESLPEPSTTFGGLLLSCVPETINLRWQRSERDLHLVDCLQKKLVEMHNQNLINEFGRSVFHADEEKCQKQPQDWMNWSDVVCKDCNEWKEIRFDLLWNLPCCSSKMGDEPTSKRLRIEK